VRSPRSARLMTSGRSPAGSRDEACETDLAIFQVATTTATAWLAVPWIFHGFRASHARDENKRHGNHLHEGKSRPQRAAGPSSRPHGARVRRRACTLADLPREEPTGSKEVRHRRPLTDRQDLYWRVAQVTSIR
jgi:hypothetical protein